MSRATREADQQIEREASSDYMKSRRSLARRLSQVIFGRTDRRYPQEPTLPPFQVPSGDDGTPTPPPVQPPDGWGGIAVPPPYPPAGGGAPSPPPAAPPIAPPAGGKSGGGGSPPRPPRPPRPPLGNPDPPEDDGDGSGDGYDDIEILGRDASYDSDDWKVVMDQMRLTPGSSNVYGYYFEFESRTTGILYVTFLGGRGERRSGPGHTYAYYTVPGRKYHEFQKEAASSAGNAVWDFLRIRGTMWGHQYQYRLIQSHGDYVPRKATKKGFRTRHVAEVGATGRRSYRRSTLPERIFPSGKPDRGSPDRGEPDRGDSLF